MSDLRPLSRFRSRWRGVAAVVTLALASAGLATLGAPTAAATSPDVVLSEAYGGGGNSGASYTNDFVELHNRGGSSVDLSGWSVQYAASTSTNWSVTTLAGSIAPGGKYLIELAAGSSGDGEPLPAPDATGSTRMSASSGKVALVTNGTELTCGSDCDTASGVRDFLGYGSADDYETSPAPTLSNTTSATRVDPSTDTDDNAADFDELSPSPQNSASTGGTASSCSTSGTWTQGELNTYWFDVEQGDAQLVVGPTGKTLLVDLGETAWNSTGTNTRATLVAQQIRDICGISSGPVHLDYVMASHHHLDHIGYAANPNDTSDVGNGLYQLLTPADVGGFGFTVGQLIDRDGGVWTDANGDGDCDVGTSSAPSNEVDWHHAGTTSQTSRRWICWLYGPSSQADRAIIDGHVLRLTNSDPWPAIGLGDGVTAEIVMANAKGVMQADGVTPVSGDHTADATPPSENDYSIGLRIAYGPFVYATAGDSDGEYDTSSFGYTYNDIEAHLVNAFGEVAAARANHHGSTHSSSDSYVTGLSPQIGFISCGNNSYGHPANRVLDAFRSVGADIFLANDPCDTEDPTGAPIDYSGTFNDDGTVSLVTSGGGAGFTVTYDAGSRSYTTGS